MVETILGGTCMREILKKRMVFVEKGEQIIDKDILLVADSNYYSCLKVAGKVIGNVSVFRENTIGGLCPTNVNVVILPGGSLDGDVSNVDKVDIAGECSGDIKAQIVVIRQGAVVRGNINCVVLYGDETAAKEGAYCYFRKAAMPED